MVRASDELALGLSVFFVTEVPLHEQILTLCVTVHSLAITTKLRVVRGKETETCVHAVDECLDLLFITKDHAALPVRSNGAEVNDLDVADWVNDLGYFCCRNVAHGTPLESAYFSHSTGQRAPFFIRLLRALTLVNT